MRRLSRYNLVVPWQAGMYLAYSGRTGAVALMKPENYATYQSIEKKIAGELDPEFSPEEQQLLAQMEYAGMIYENGTDEIETLRRQHDAVRADDRTVGLVLAPAMACNMACPYCFEMNKKGLMSPETVGAVLAYLENKAPSLKNLSMTWYGGEPLLALDIMEEISKSIFAMQQNHQFDYGATVVSNGYLMDEHVVDRLLRMKISSAQVTIDGPARLHNVRRPLKNGKPSFETILRNIANASTRMNVSVRVNVGRDFNDQTIVEMLEEFSKAGIQERVLVYFGCLDAATQVCANIAEDCYLSPDFSRIETQYFRLLFDRGFRVEKLPQPMTHYCMAQTRCGFVLDHEGNMYRCLNFIGDPSKSMGNIRDEVDYGHPNFTSLYVFNPFKDTDCVDCRFLPVCMGGCPARRNRSDLTRDAVCESWRYNLPDMLEIIARSRYRQLQSAGKELS